VPAPSHSHGTEPVEVARDGGLGDVDLLGGEQLDELPLRGDLAAIEDGGEYLVSRVHHA
jgi:hypothetical protein